MQLNRRQFLKIAGVTGAVAVPALLGYELLLDAQGELPPNLSPYAQLDTLESWPTDPGAASPVLLLINEQSDNPFGLYLAEILRAEGLNCFQIAHLSSIETAPLHWYDVVLLAEGPLTTRQVERLETYVASGGRLVAMRPDARLAPLLGVEWLGASTSEGYLQVNTDHPVGQGIATRALQYHGTADHYRLAGAEAVAWLSGPDDVPTDFPAVTLCRSGQGQATLWAFDLGRSVAYTRQGNPTWANQERDGGDGIRAADMFKDWVDLDRLLIPQADEQQRLFANLFGTLSQDKRPLPRLWYFPGTSDSMLIATGDSHGNPASAIEDVLTRVEQRQGHFSTYYTAFPHSDVARTAKKNLLRGTALPIAGDILAERFDAPTATHVASWRARGHEFAMHPYVEEGLEPAWRIHWQEFTGLDYGPVPPTVRTHRILWTGWAETARIQATLGMRMNLDYYHWGPAFRAEAGQWRHGHFTGSGRPMRFVDEKGRILGIYQQLTQIADDHLLDLHWGGVARMSARAALDVSETLLRNSVNGDYCAIAANFHVDPFEIGGEWITEASSWLEGTLDLAATLGIPIWSAEEWLHFTETRARANLEEVEWQSATGHLHFRLAALDASSVELTVMVPLRHGEADLSQIEVDATPAVWRTRDVGGVSYGGVSVSAGPHQFTVTYV